ncbi:cystathionine gamma-synthase 1, chloroplastic-like [Canna indica]|uniref:plant cystathionine gamma-synthase n=1 Tax=Canna indica TaxID=4628 RepID=A0AAQ3Q1S8_9LILI|nr:cystathionine gamma-synthase 1, chloroplastic-like [Canna indica]
MAVSSAICPSPLLSAAASAGDRSDTGARPRFEKTASTSFLRGVGQPRFSGLSSTLILRFPPNFVRQLSTKARRNCSNIGVAQIVAASWSNSSPSFEAPRSAAAADAVVVPEVAADEANTVTGGGFDSRFVDSPISGVGDAKLSSAAPKVAASLSTDGSLAVHAGERFGRGITTDAITTPVVNTSAYWFNNSDELIDFKEKRHASFEYGRYGNPTTQALEEKMSALERAESTLFVASGMYASVAMLSTLVPAGGHLVITTDCYRKTRVFIENELPKMGISVTVIDPADVESLKSALDQNNVSLFFSESPTNPFLRCVDVELVSQLCHNKGALVCIDGTFASPLNQKSLTLGADLVLHSATKFIAGHNDVLGGCISGREELISKIRLYHHVIGGVLNPNAAYMILRGMKTLHLRVQNQNNTALRMAQFLEEHPKIIRVYYPGLPSHPEHHIAKRQMTGFGGVVSFEVAGDLNTTKKFIDSLKIPYLAPSFGGCESIVDQPAIMSYWDLGGSERVAKYGIKDNLVRFSFGVEGFEDLKADIVQALEKI